jgi:hypothetical protein
MPPRPPLLITPSPSPFLSTNVRPDIQRAVIPYPPPLALLPPPSSLPLPFFRLPRARMRIPTRLPTPLRPPSFPSHRWILNPHLPQTQLPSRLHQPPIRILHPPLPQTHLPRAHPNQNILSIRVLDPHIPFLFLRPAFLGVRSKEHFEECSDGSIMLCVADRRSA